jgi:creatinine amidohydrolase
MSKIFFAHMTSPEVRAAVTENCVAIIPIGTIEQHGPHLPVDTDVLLAESVVEVAVNKTGNRGKAIIFPSIPYSYAMNQAHLPGTIAIESDTFIQLMVEICRGISQQGFRKIFLVNGHAPNISSLDVAANRITNEGNSLVAVANYWSFGRSQINEIREAKEKGGMSHACEFETSLYLALHPERVQMEKAIDENNQTPSNYYWRDISIPAPVLMWDPFQIVTKSGVLGHATMGTREKGEKLIEVITNDLANFIIEFSEREYHGINGGGNT